MFEFILFPPRICFCVYGLISSKNVSLEPAGLAQSVKRCMTVAQLTFRHG